MLTTPHNTIHWHQCYVKLMRNNSNVALSHYFMASANIYTTIVKIEPKNHTFLKNVINILCGLLIFHHIVLKVFYYVNHKIIELFRINVSPVYTYVLQDIAMSNCRK